MGLWFIAGPWWAVGLAAIIPALLTWPLVSAFRKRGRRENWVLAVDRRGVWLNLRDVEYHEAEPGDSVVSIPYEEIGSARRVINRYTTPSGNGRTRVHKDICLELSLARPQIDSLREAIAAEWKRELPEKRHFGGAVKSRSRRTHSPIETDGDNAVRIKFTAGNIGLRPTIKKTLAALKEFVKVQADEESQAVGWRDLTGEELDATVRRLALNGQSIDALNLLQRRRGMSAREAKDYVDEVREGVRSAVTSRIP